MGQSREGNRLFDPSFSSCMWRSLSDKMTGAPEEIGALNSTIALLGSYFFIGLGVTAFVMEHRKKEPRVGLLSIGAGGTMLSGILLVTSINGTWSNQTGFLFAAAVACVLFFYGLFQFALYHRKK